MFKFSIALLVAGIVLIEIVLATVNLDDKLVLQTQEIQNVSAVWSLPSKVVAALSP